MDEKQQQEFTAWLGDKLQAKDQNDLEKKLKTLGDDGIRKAYDQFMSEKSDSNADQDSDSIQSNKLGGKLNYIKCLQAFAKGGAMKIAECGCGGKLADGGKVNTGKLVINKDQGDRKDSNKKDMGKQGKQYIKSTSAEKSDKPSDIKKSGEMQYGGKMKKHQYGGVATYAQGTPKPSSIIVDKGNGQTGQWGNDLPQDPGHTFMLAPSSNGVNQINQAQYDHLVKNVPNFRQLVPMMQKPGEVARFGSDQSDIIRKLLNQYPMQKAQPQQAQQSPIGSLTARLARGGRIDEEKNTDQASGIKDPKAPMKTGLKGKRKDVNKKESNPGGKDYMDLGNTKKEHTAITKLVKKQGGGAMSGTVGGMTSGGGAKAAPSLVKKKVKVRM